MLGVMVMVMSIPLMPNLLADGLCHSIPDV
jgi:hypothetical protein